MMIDRSLFPLWSSRFKKNALPIRSSIDSSATASISKCMTDPKRLSRAKTSNQRAKLIAEIAADETIDRLVTDDGRDLAAVILGRRGGLKGGRARAEILTPDRRREIAVKAAQSRWRKVEDADGKD